MHLGSATLPAETSRDQRSQHIQGNPKQETGSFFSPLTRGPHSVPAQTTSTTHEHPLDQPSPILSCRRASTT